MFGFLMHDIKRDAKIVYCLNLQIYTAQGSGSSPLSLLDLSVYKL